MKPQIIIPVSLLMLAFVLCSNTSYGINKNYKKAKSEESTYKISDIKTPADPLFNGTKQNQPSKPQKKDHDKDNMPLKDATHRRNHSEEDGKHHHFHLHRAKKIKRCSGLVCLLAKILLVITHICLLISVFHATVAHVAH